MQTTQENQPPRPRYQFGGRAPTTRKAPPQEPQEPALPRVMSLATKRPATLTENIRDGFADLGANLCRGSRYAAEASRAAAETIRATEARALTAPPPPIDRPAQKEIAPAKQPDASQAASPMPGGGEGEGLDIGAVGAKPDHAAEGFKGTNINGGPADDLGIEIGGADMGGFIQIF